MYKLIIFAIFCTTSLAYQCKNENNETVDWYILYKIPHVPHDHNKLLRRGVAYAFITSENTANGWKLSNISINDTSSMPGYTLQPLYMNNSAMYLLYNDQPPSSKSDSNKGHTKGVLLSNDTLGIWLIHSVPHYPPLENYQYPITGVVYGQSFLCISLDLNNLNQVGRQLQYNHPHTYSANLPDSLKDQLPNIDAVLKNTFINDAPWYNLVKLYSRNKEEFMSFAKTKKFGKEIYADWISVVLNNDLLVETWLNGPGKISSACGGTHTTCNVQEVNITNVAFKSTEDHSKWAISNEQNDVENYWVCIGDINREISQKKRGGGTTCISNANIWNSYKNIIAGIESCKNNYD